LAPIAIKSKDLVFCLLTALELHGLTTQSAHEVWVAIGQKTRAPKLEYPPLHVVRMSDLKFGIMTKTVDEVVQIPVTNVAKTIADCFKFRNKIGLDIALEALRDAWQQKKVTMDELWRAAEHCRVANVMRPYLESLV
jgi:predicted transcriptional regulator of viral defense system